MPDFTHINTPATELKQGSPRFFSGVNWIGLWTLYQKEVWRFVKVVMQTVAAPIINGLLFLAIFALALGQYRPAIAGIDFMTFLAPGLIMMSVIQNAFANTSSSILIAKVQGNIVDYLMPPLSPLEINTAMIGAGITRGFVVALGTGLAMAYFVDLKLHSLPLLAFYIFSGGMLMSLLGLISGIWAEKFDHLQTVSNFVILPLSFLSGTFYSVKQLPEQVFWISQYNPFFYMIDGMRYSLTGYTDSNVMTGVFVLTACNIILWFICQYIIKIGWHLKT